MNTRIINESCHLSRHRFRQQHLPVWFPANDATGACWQALSVRILSLLLSLLWLTDAAAQDSPVYLDPSAQTFMATPLAPEVTHSFVVLQNLTEIESELEFQFETFTRLISVSLCEGSCVNLEGNLSSDNELTQPGSSTDTVNGSWSLSDSCFGSGDFCSAAVTFTGSSPGSSSLQLIAEYQKQDASGEVLERFYAAAALLSETEDTTPDQTISLSAGIASAAEGSRVPIVVSRSASPCCDRLSELTVSVSVGSSSSATEDVDFSFADGSSVVWNAGEAGDKTLFIDLLTDTENEPIERIDLIVDAAGLPAQVAVANAQASIAIQGNATQTDLTTAIVSGTEQGLVPGQSVDDLVVQVTGDAVGQPGLAIRVEWRVVPESAALLSSTTTFANTSGTASNRVDAVLERGFIQVFATATVESVVQAPPAVVPTIAALSSDSAPPGSALQLTPRIDPPPAPELASNVARFILRSGFFPASGLNENQSNTGNALDNACTELTRLRDADASLTPGQSDLLTTCSQLDAAVQAGGLSSAINRLMPEETFAMADSSVEASDIQLTNVVNRINALRNGSARALNLSGLSLDYRDQHIPGAVFNAVQDALSATDTTDTSVVGSRRLGIFASGRLSVGEIDGADNQKSADFSTQGVTLGADYRVSPQVVLGGSVGFASVDTDFKGDQDGLAVEGAFVTLFGTWYDRDVAYVDAVLQAGDNTYESRRRINLPGQQAMFANGSTDAQIGSFTIGAGQQYSRQNWEFGPYLRATVTSASVDGFTETAANQGPGIGSILSISSHSVQSTTVSAGLQISASVSTPRVVLVPQFWLEGEFETQSSKDDISASFVHDPTNSIFSISGNERDSSYINYGLGTSVFWPGLRSVFVFFESQLGHDYITQYWLKFGTRVSF